jgi:hypothetical protein
VQRIVDSFHRIINRGECSDDVAGQPQARPPHVRYPGRSSISGDFFSLNPNRTLQPIRLTMDFAIIQPKLSTIG